MPETDTGCPVKINVGLFGFFTFIFHILKFEKIGKMSFQGCINHIQIGHENPVKGEGFILFFKSRRFCEVLQTDPMGMMMSYFVILAPFKKRNDFSKPLHTCQTDLYTTNQSRNNILDNSSGV